MTVDWVLRAWDRRHEPGFLASDDAFVAAHRMKPFQGLNMAFVGFSPEEKAHMAEELFRNGGRELTVKPSCHFKTTTALTLCFFTSADGRAPDSPSGGRLFGRVPAGRPRSERQVRDQKRLVLGFHSGKICLK